MSLAENLVTKYEETMVIVDSLLSLTNKKLEALKTNNLDELNHIIQEQDAELRYFFKKEQEVILEQDNLAKSLGLEEYRLDEVITKVDCEQAKKLSDLQPVLRNKLAELQQTNELNQSIINQNLAYIQNMVKTINELNKRGNNQVYSNNGQIKKDETKSLLDKQV